VDGGVAGALRAYPTTTTSRTFLLSAAIAAAMTWVMGPIVRLKIAEPEHEPGSRNREE
jgi:hypothetical protein